MKTTSAERICICCPAGCHLTITETGDHQFQVTGNSCPRGRQYGISEMTDPRRTVTACIPTDSPEIPCIPVKTDAPLPRHMINSLLRTLYSMRISLPVQAGQIILPDFHSTGINIVTTGSAEINTTAESRK